MKKSKEMPDLGIKAEALLAENFTEDWVVQADQLNLALLRKKKPVFRIHSAFSPPPGAGPVLVHGHLFDSNKMADSIIEQMGAFGEAGYSFAIAKNGLLVEAGAGGYARMPAEADTRLMSPHTRMVSASLAKPLCALAIMKLVEDAEISLPDRAYPYIESRFPDVHSSIRNITFYQLLTHTSGLNGGTRLSQFPSMLLNPASPTANSVYHNANYWFLGLAIEGIAGEGYSTFATDQILNPMGITGITREAGANPCLYYREGEVEDGVGFGDYATTAVGAYGWYGSAIDWARFLVYFRFDEVLSRDTRHILLDDTRRIMGFAKWRNQRRGTYYGHGGDFKNSSDNGFRGGMMGFPDLVDAVLLINTRGAFDPETILINAYHEAYA